MSKASEVSACEGFLESAPQMILQLSLFLKTGKLSKIELPFFIFP
jgi:hypothetical protein